MKLVLTFLFLCFHLISQGQDYYIKTHPTVMNQNQSAHIESLADGSYVIAGFGGAPADSTTLLVRKYNACGTELWAREIASATKPLDLVEMNIDSNQNIVLVGKRDLYNQNPLPYIIKLNQSGAVIYSKLLSSTLGFNVIVYSSSIASNGDYYLFGIHRYTTSPPNNHSYYIARLSPNGTLKWAKNLSTFAFVWGTMSATRDGGLVVKFSNTIVKLDSLGNKQWAKDYSHLGTLITPTETDSGFVFARYFIGGIDRGSLFSIRHDGSVHWATNSFFNFFPFRGITRKNGNVLYPGNNHFNSNSAVFLEVDAKDGSIQNFQEITNSQGYYATDLSENKQQEIIFSGPDNRGIIPHQVIGKLNDTLSTRSCVQDTLSRPSDVYTAALQGDNPLTVFTNTDLTTSNFQLVVSTLPIFQSSNECAYTKPRGSYNLGKDTILCRGQSLTIGHPNSDFDSYLWSSGSNRKTMALNQSGTYWLQVVSACDTLRDTINVSIQAGILFLIGSDTLICADSLVLGEVLDSALNYVWSTGETTRTITIKTTGTYWVEHSNKCHTTRDSIDVLFRSPLPPINLGNDTILCPKQSILLGDRTSPYDTFNWSDGSKKKTLQVSAVGGYWLRATETCGTTSDTIQVDYYPNIGLELGNDTSICKGDLLVLGISQTLNNYQWSTGATTPAIVVSAAGTYWLKTQTICGSVIDSIEIRMIPILKAPKIGSDTSICFGETIELKAVYGVTFTWSTSENSQSIQVGEGVYWLEYFNTCDTVRDSITISYFKQLKLGVSQNTTTLTSKDTLHVWNSKLEGYISYWDLGDGTIKTGDSISHSYRTAGNYVVKLTVIDTNNCSETATTTIQVTPCFFFVPNVFTPNNDLINDEFRPVGVDIQSFNLQIFNRWGDLIFSGKNIAWNGTNSEGKALKHGVYRYVISIELYDGKKDALKGELTLIR